MNWEPEPISDIARDYVFEIGFAVILSIYCQVLVSSPPLIPIHGLPVGLLIVPSALFYPLCPVSIVLSLFVGFWVGWITKKLWQRGIVGRSIVVTGMAANSISFAILYRVLSALAD